MNYCSCKLAVEFTEYCQQLSVNEAKHTDCSLMELSNSLNIKGSSGQVWVLLCFYYKQHTWKVITIHSRYCSFSNTHVIMSM